MKKILIVAFVLFLTSCAGPAMETPVFVTETNVPTSTPTITQTATNTPTATPTFTPTPLPLVLSEVGKYLSVFSQAFSWTLVTSEDKNCGKKFPMNIYLNYDIFFCGYEAAGFDWEDPAQVSPSPSYYAPMFLYVGVIRSNNWLDEDDEERWDVLMLYTKYYIPKEIAADPVAMGDIFKAIDTPTGDGPDSYRYLEKVWPIPNNEADHLMDLWAEVPWFVIDS